MAPPAILSRSRSVGSKEVLTHLVETAAPEVQTNVAEYLLGLFRRRKLFLSRTRRQELEAITLEPPPRAALRIMQKDWELADAWEALLDEQGGESQFELKIGPQFRKRFDRKEEALALARMAATRFTPTIFSHHAVFDPGGRGWVAVDEANERLFFQSWEAPPRVTEAATTG